VKKNLKKNCVVSWCCDYTEAVDEGSNSSASGAQKRGDSDATLVSADVKFLPRDSDSTAATPTSGHVTPANEHDHMVSSTIHSDGQLLLHPHTAVCQKAICYFCNNLYHAVTSFSVIHLTISQTLCGFVPVEFY